jgi:DnaJ-class molecular chaperone
MAGSCLKRFFLRHETEAGKPTVPCPGCGGRGRFEWSRDIKIPRQWSWDAPCGMCDGRGRIPRSWLRDKPTTRSA